MEAEEESQDSLDSCEENLSPLQITISAMPQTLKETGITFKLPPIKIGASSIKGRARRTDPVTSIQVQSQGHRQGHPVHLTPLLQTTSQRESFNPAEAIPNIRSTSKYHAHCGVPKETPLYSLRKRIPSPSPTRGQLLIPAPRIQQRSTTPGPPLRRFNSSRNISADRSGMVDADQVSAYLEAHPEFLENHVLEHVPVEQLERWLIRRSQREKNKFLQVNGPSERKISLSRWKFCVHADKRQMLQGLMTSLATRPQPSRVLWELSCCIASAVGADGFILHLVDPHSGNLRQHRTIDCRQGSPEYDKATDEDNEDEDVSDSQPMTVAFHVAQNKETLRIKDARQIDSRFPNGSPCLQQGGVHVLAAPVLQSDGTLSAVLELYRTTSREDVGETFPDRTFHEEDEEIVTSYLVWGGIALHYADLYHALKKQRDLHQFLLTVVKAIFQDMVSMDSVIAKVMTFAQRLVNADRASLFLVDNKSRELYARIFDMGNGVTEKVAQEIRFPIGTGIAGQVALTGEVLNIPDAYQDPRFNRAVDQQTGYHTRSILCMPIFSRNQVIGVVQMVNKYHGTFNQEDEESFELFAVYCGLALHHAKLYDRVRRSEQKYRVALEVLSYHNTCSDEETQLVKEELTFQNAPLGIDQFWFSAFSIDDLEKVRCAVFMFVDLFGLTRFDQNSLVKFTLTVRKNYRRVPYHNWTHGFAVANTMYAILKKAPGIFAPLEALALFVGSLCHDLDHRGKNNKFMLETASPLAAIYTTSTMEHHHFNQTVTILQQEGHNIFSKLGSEEYKQVLSNIKHCILATDLAVFFPNRAKLASVVETGSFAWDNSDHRFLVEAIAMTAADLSASSKPWDIQAETVKVIFDEFYEQGDIEKAQGKIPPPMMDRSKPHLQPDSQVGFISGICIPCYGLLQKLIPETKPLLDGCESNLKRWKELAEENENIQPQDEPANPEPTQKAVVVNPQPDKVDFEFLEEFE